MTKLKPFFRMLACLGTAIPLVVGGASNSSAYDGGAAAAYAEVNAEKPSGNTAFPYFSGADCTNFVSQSLHAGGYDYRGGSSESADNQWWIRHEQNIFNVWVWNYTTTWIRAGEFRNFLILDVPGGNSRSTAPGSSTSAYTPAAIKTGDVLNYDFGDGKGISHTAIQVPIGKASDSTFYGNLVDYHSTNTKHNAWHLRPKNARWATTTIYFQHVDAGN